MAENDRSVEQVARNNAIFRDANERIEGAAAAYDADERVPFLCECPDPRCTRIAQIPVDAYEAIRAVPTYFISTHGDEGHDWATLVEDGDGYQIVEKVGEAAEIAEELDPRARDGRA